MTENHDANTYSDPPEGLGDRGQDLWRTVLDEYDLGAHELILLAEAAHTVDLLAQLQNNLVGECLIDEDGKVAPVAVELRQQRLALLRIFATLRLPLGDEDSDEGGSRLQRRGSARGAYGRRS